jgi:hypothetical protein
MTRQSERPANDGGNGSGFMRRRRGYDIAARPPLAAQITRNFGGDRRMIVQFVESRVANVGFVPALPVAHILRIRTEEPPSNIRVRQDGAIDAGVLEPGQVCILLSDVAADNTYGRHTTESQGPPLLKSQKPNRFAMLSKAQRRTNLQLPAALLRPESRMRRFVQRVLRSALARDSDYLRAKRLALAVQSSAVYTLRPPQIPEGRDAAEYFLFESRRGYCTYFAGALTVACRVAGIPARVVSGFVNPDWTVTGEQTGVLREANAHAWTEVWVDGWGWAPLDATPADNRGHNAPEWWDDWAYFFTSTADTARHWIAAHRALVIWFALILIPLVLLAAVRRGLADPIVARLLVLKPGRVPLGRDQTRRLIGKAYRCAAKKLARKFRRAAAWETPHEYLAAAETALDLENPQPLRELTQLYTRACYSPATLEAVDSTRAYQALRVLSFRRRR